MSRRIRHAYTFYEYLCVAKANPLFWYEYVDGDILATLRGTREEANIVSNILELLSASRPPTWRVHPNGIRISAKDANFASCPDAMVFDGEPEPDPRDPSGWTMTNPVVLVDILRPAIEDYVRSERLEYYKRIPSLQEVVLVAGSRREVNVIRRMGTSWKYFEYVEGAAELASMNCTMPLDEIYRPAQDDRVTQPPSYPR